MHLCALQTQLCDENRVFPVKFFSQGKKNLFSLQRSLFSLQGWVCSVTNYAYLPNICVGPNNPVGI